MSDSETPEWDDSDLVRELQAEIKPIDPSDPAMMRAACDFWWDEYIEITEQQAQRNLTLTDEVRNFLSLTESLAIAAEGNSLDSTPLVMFIHDAQSFYFGSQPQLPVAGPPVQILLDRLKYR